MPGRCPVANGRRGRIDLVPSPGGVLLVITHATVGTCLGSSTSHGSRSSKGAVESDSALRAHRLALRGHAVSVRPELRPPHRFISRLIVARLLAIESLSASQSARSPLSSAGAL
jgi:hypothetical protein